MATTELPEGSGVQLQELIAIVLLSVTAVFTAWAGFQASKWKGSTSISFSQASTARVQASHLEATADKQEALQVSLFGQWVQAHGAGQHRTEEFIASRFPQPLDTAFRAWVATSPDTNLDAPSTPFAMPEYVLTDRAAADAAEQRAEQRFVEGVAASKQADDYTLLTVIYALVLFFAGMSIKVRARSSKWAMVWVGALLFTGTTIVAVVLPKLW